MKKKNFLYCVLALIFVLSVGVTALNSAEHYIYYAYFTVQDQDGNAYPNIDVRLHVYYEWGGDDFQEIGYGTTDANGQATVVVELNRTSGVVLTELRSSLLNGDKYVYFTMTGNYSTTSNTLYPFYQVGYDSDENEVVDSWELALAQKFIPDMYMSNGNLMYPAPVEVMLDKFSLCRWSAWPIYYDVMGTTETVPPTSGQSIFNQFENSWNSDWWLNWGGYNFSRGRIYWHDFWNVVKNNYSPTIYSHTFRYSPTSSNYVIQYWFFYPYNEWGGNHEGDWEHINVKVSSQNPSIAQPLEVVYYFHYKRITKNWTNVERVDTYHPRVYVGGEVEWLTLEGSESGGSYPYSGYYSSVEVNLGGIINVDENITAGTHYSYNNFQIINMSNTFNLWWMKFPGHWGVPLEHIIRDNDLEVQIDGPISPPHHPGWNVYHQANSSEW